MIMFKYLNTRSYKEMHDIFEVVRGLKPYAEKIYKENYEDVLDAAYEHIVKNFDSEKGDLENYAIRVVKTIGLNSSKKEIASNEQTLLSLDALSAKGYISSQIEGMFEENLKSENIDSCIKDMVVFFVKDFKFFETLAKKNKQLDYSKLEEKYSKESIVMASSYLKSKHYEVVKDFISYSKRSSIRNFDEDRYLKSLDSSLEYRGCLNDIVMLRRKQGSHIKRIFKVCLKDTIDTILRLFYGEGGCGKITLEGVEVYCTLSGKIASSYSELRYYLEKELVGSLLSRTALKVLKYDKGNEILLSSTKDIHSDIILPLFGKSFCVTLDRVVVKEV